MWAAYGEYQWTPPGRWLHNLEHGAVVFLYHPCTNQKTLQDLKSLAKNCLWKHIISSWDTGLSINYPVALVSWANVLRLRNFEDQGSRDAALHFVEMHALAGGSGEGHCWGNGGFVNGIINHAKLVTSVEDDQICPNGFVRYSWEQDDSSFGNDSISDVIDDEIEDIDNDLYENGVDSESEIQEEEVSEEREMETKPVAVISASPTESETTKLTQDTELGGIRPIFEAENLAKSVLKTAEQGSPNSESEEEAFHEVNGIQEPRETHQPAPTPSYQHLHATVSPQMIEINKDNALRASISLIFLVILLLYVAFRLGFSCSISFNDPPTRYSDSASGSNLRNSTYYDAASSATASSSRHSSGLLAKFNSFFYKLKAGNNGNFMIRRNEDGGSDEYVKLMNIDDKDIDDGDYSSIDLN